MWKKIFSGAKKKKTIADVDTPIVKDYIIPLKDYPHLKQNQTLQDVVKKILSYGKNDCLKYTTALILDNQNKLVGQVTLKDILHGLAPRLEEACQKNKFQGKKSQFPNLAVLLGDSLWKKCADHATKPIKDFMSPIENFIEAKTPILKAMVIMLNSNDFNVPVVENNQVIGVLRLEEVFQAFNSHCKIVNNM